MNWAHFRAFLWLRWRLLVNQCRRAGALSAALLIIFVFSAAILSIPMFIGVFALGTYLIPKAQPAHLMYVWDGLIFLFMVFWMIGLLTELQRNDPLALSKFMHLPVSIRGAFLINYASSLLRLSLMVFGPIMLAYALALVYVQGSRQLAVVPALLAFYLMITAPTYQFQGWLGSMMSNPRRRRAIVVGATMLVVLVFQLPNLVNLYIPRMVKRQGDRNAAYAAEEAKLLAAVSAKQITPEEFQRLQNEGLERHVAENKRADDEESARVASAVRLANSVVPLGWLPIGVAASAEGNVVPGYLGMAGMALIGSASLALAYRSTLKQFQGQDSNREAPKVVAAVRRESSEAPPQRGRLIEARLPWASERVSVIALGSFQSLVRMPEAKIALLMPLILGGVFGSILLQHGKAMPGAIRPLYGVGAIAMVLFGMLQLLSNQFGMDRDGFRVFVLCAAPRRDILLGKNLALLPVALLMSTVLLIGLQVFCPMRADHALAMIPQFVTMYLLFCLMANVTSILTPVYMTPGTLKPAHPKTTTILLQLLLFLFIFPTVQMLTLIPLGVEALVRAYGVAGGWPIGLLLTVAGCVGTVLFYRVALGWLGEWLQSREQRILETVTNRGL